MIVLDVDVKNLVPYENNPRINEAAIDKVAKSIEVHGFNQPLVIDQGNRICVGHTRFYAAKRLDLQHVPVYRKEMSEAEFIAYNIADNKTSDYSTWDEELLKENVTELNELQSDLLDSIGFSDDDLAGIFDDLDSKIGFSDEFIKEEKPPKEKAKPSKLVHKCPNCGHEVSVKK